MSCGPACCRQLLLDRGFDVSESLLRVTSRCDTITGSAAGDLAAALNAAVGSEEYRGGGVDPDDLPKLMRRAPFLALLKLSSRHWIVVDGQEGSLVRLRDPAGAPGDHTVGAEAMMRIEEFHERWKFAVHAVVFRERMAGS